MTYARVAAADPDLGLLNLMCKFPSDMASCSNVFLELYVFPLVDDEQVEAGG